MVSKPAPNPAKREGINPSGIIVMMLVFGLVSAGLISHSKSGWNLNSQKGAGEKAVSVKAPVNARDIIGEFPQPEPVGKTAAAPKPERKPAPNPTVARPVPSEPETMPTRAGVERRAAAVPPIAAPRPTSVSIEKEAPPVTAPKLITAAELNAGKSAPGIERVDVKSIGGKAIPWYSVRVGYTDSKARADILRDVLVQQGFIKAETRAAGEGNYYVSLGDYMFRYQAEDVAGQIKTRTSMEPQVFEKTVAR